MPDRSVLGSQGISIVTLLKNSTREAHESIQQSMDVSRRLRGLATYRSMLEALFGFFEPMETNLRAVPEFWRWFRTWRAGGDPDSWRTIWRS